MPTGFGLRNAMTRATLVLVAALALASPLTAQQLRGTVREAGTGRAVPGAVVSVMDSVGGTLRRTIADETGAYSVPLVAGSRAARVIRIGFRPRDLTLPESGGDVSLDVSLQMIPTFLEPARVQAKACPKRDDAAQAAGLWEQARAGLLTGIVAREEKPATLIRVHVYRRYGGPGGRLDRQTVAVDTASEVSNTFKAAFDAGRFAEFGFTDVQNGQRYFNAPDAETLFDAAFSNAYCFRIARGDRSRPHEVGLGFEPADSRAGRVDIEGVLWVDTVARALHDIKYDYVNLERRAQAFRPGGVVSFREVPNGVVFVDAWEVRLPDAAPDSITDDGRQSVVISHDALSIGGGQVAHATWKDGTRYDAPLAGAELFAHDASGAPTPGRQLLLLSTTFRTWVNAAGQATFSDLPPGRYSLVVREPSLAPLRLDSLPTFVVIDANLDRVFRDSVVVPTVEEWVRQLCRGGGKVEANVRRRTTDRALVLARVMDAEGVPFRDVNWSFEVQTPASPTGWTEIRGGGRTKTDGLVYLCTDVVEGGQRIAINLKSGKRVIGRLEQALEPGPLTIIPLVIKR